MFYTRSWPIITPCLTQEADLFVRHVLHKKLTYLYAMLYTKSWPICKPCFTQKTDLFVSRVLHKKLTYLCAMLYTRSWPICTPCFTQNADLFVNHVLYTWKISVRLIWFSYLFFWTNKNLTTKCINNDGLHIVVL
jgi:uncharacterized membrane protein